MQRNINSLVNEVMASDAGAVMLFAPSGYGKTDFLTELASRYQTVYWLNPHLGDTDNLLLTLAQNVFATDAQLLQKVRQMIYCRTSFAAVKLTAAKILQHISDLKRDVLLVLENAEALPKDFDTSVLERLIKHSPPNLKIVVSSDTFINFDYMRFEPKYPKLIDENMLEADATTIDDYLSDLSPADCQFLATVAPLEYVDANFANTIYPDGAELLELLSRKRKHVSSRVAGRYRLSIGLRQHLSDGQNQDIFAKFGDYLFDEGKYMDALRQYISSGDPFKIDKTLQMIVRDRCLLLQLEGVCKHSGFAPTEKHQSFLFFDYFAMCAHFANKNLRAANEYLDMVIELSQTFDKRLYSLCIFHKARLLLEEGKSTDAYNLIQEKYKESQENGDFFAYEELFLLLPRLARDLDNAVNLTMAENFEQLIGGTAYCDQIWYISAQQAIAEAYFEYGNYKRAIQVITNISTHIDFYAIPHHLIHFYYYSGDIDNAHFVARTALEFAAKHEISEDVSLVYTTLAAIDLYYGRKQEAFQKYDHAITLDREVGYAKFYNISQRCLAYARHGDIKYAKEVAHVYYKYCQTYCPQYNYMMQCAMAYCSFKQADYESVYKFASACVKASKSRSVYWLMGMAMATTCLLKNNDLKDAKTLIRNILISSNHNGMETVPVDNQDIFAQLFAYAADNEIEMDYLERINKKFAKKTHIFDGMSALEVMIFGDSAVMLNGTEIKWKTRKSKELFLHYMLSYKNGMDRAAILDSLWKDYMYESAINNLKTTNNLIRKTLNACKVEFELSYINSKYIIRIKNLNCDYHKYLELMDAFDRDTNLRSLCDIMHNMLKLYRADFGLDLHYPCFNEERTRLKHELTINLLKLIRMLARSEKYTEARDFLSSLMYIDRTNDYHSMSEELDKFSGL